MSEINSSKSTIIKVLNALEDGNAKNISEIARKTKLTWDTTKSTLQKLEALNNVFRIESEKTKYVINPNSIDYGTYFNLPISREEKQRVFGYFNYINFKWRELADTQPTQIHIYKTLSALNKEFNLQLPFGYYTHGDCCMVPFKVNEDYSQYEVKITAEEEEKTQETINNIKELKFTQIKRMHYNENDKKTYQLKEDIMGCLYREDIDLTTTNIQEFIKQLRKDSILDENIQLCYDYLDLVFLFKRNSKISFSEFRDEFIDTFKTLWQLIAINYLKNDLKNRYEYIVLEKCFENKIRETKDQLQNSYFNLELVLKSSLENPLLNKYFQKLNIDNISREDIKNS